MAEMRAKMRLDSVLAMEASEQLTFKAVAKKGPYPSDGSDEDNTYAKFSPYGELKLTVANPALLGKFKPGDVFYLDFIKAEK